MRRIVSVFLVVLLVLRGLLGDAMAMGMQLDMAMAAMPTHSAMHATSPADAPVPVQESAHAAPDDGHCATATATASTTAADTSDCGSGHAPCAACAICHTPMHPPASGYQGAPRERLAAPAQTRIDFVSAALALAVKPPIA